MHAHEPNAHSRPSAHAGQGACWLTVDPARLALLGSAACACGGRPLPLAELPAVLLGVPLVPLEDEALLKLL